jgi:hypothetical protein
MKHKLLPIVLCLALLSSFCNAFPAGATTYSVVPLEVYVQRGTETAILLHTYSPAEMEALPQQTQYYTGIDSMPAIVQGKGTGVLLGTLIDDLTQYDSGLFFDADASLKVRCQDNGFFTYTYDYLFGSTRYYNPNLYTMSENNAVSGTTTGAEAIKPMFAVTSYQSRSFDDNLITPQVLDAKTLDAADSYRFCFGMTSSDVANSTITVNKFAKWTNKIYIVLPADDTEDIHTITASAGTGGTISPSGSVSVNQNAGQTFTISANSGYRIAEVKVDGASQGTAASYAFSNVTAGHTIAVTFCPIWDLNGDHKCDLGDVVVIGIKWRMTGSPGWVPEDVNKDGAINVGDVVTVGFHWNETW